MHSIESFAKSFVWDQRGWLLPATFAIPAAIEGIRLVYNVYKHPGVIKEKLASAKQWCVSSFMQGEGEEDREYRIKLAKNIAKVTVCAALIGGAIAASIICFPGTMGISVAIMAIYAVGLLIQKAPELYAKCAALKTRVVEGFTRRENETDRDFHLRVAKNIFIGVVALSALVGAGFGVYQFALFLIPLVKMVTSGGYALWKLLPKQTPLAVFLEYISVGVCHLGLGAWYWRKGEKAKALMHLGCAITAITCPIMYAKTQVGGSLLRLHHSFSGLLMMLLPSTPAKFLGSMIAADSLLYWVAPKGDGYPLRGYVDEWGDFRNFDFMNLVVPNVMLFFQVFSVLSVVERVTKSFFATQPVSREPDSESTQMSYQSINE